MFTSFTFFLLLLSFIALLQLKFVSVAVRPLSVPLLLFVLVCFFVCCYCFCGIVEKKTSITFHIIIWYRFSFENVIWCVLYPTSVQWKSLFIFVLISWFQWPSEREKKTHWKNRDYFNWNENLCNAWWFMIKILRNLSFICFPNVLTAHH